jgi:hypothetical protein
MLFPTQSTGLVGLYIDVPFYSVICSRDTLTNVTPTKSRSPAPVTPGERVPRPLRARPPPSRRAINVSSPVFPVTVPIRVVSFLYRFRSIYIFIFLNVFIPYLFQRNVCNGSAAAPMLNSTAKPRLLGLGTTLPALLFLPLLIPPLCPSPQCLCPAL